MRVDEALETFSCNLYDQAGTKSVHMARFDKPVETKRAWMQQGCPHARMLIMKIARANYVTYIWKYKHLHEPDAGVNQLDSRWELKDDKFAMVWYDGPQMPETMASDLYEDDFQNEDNEDICESSGDESSTSIDFIQILRYWCLLISITCMNQLLKSSDRFTV